MRRHVPALAMLLALLLLATVHLPFASAETGSFYAYIAMIFRTTPSDNLPVTSASYLGGEGADSISAVDVAPDGTIVVAGNFPGYAPAGITPVDLFDGGAAGVLRLSGDGKTLLSLTWLGATVDDMQVAEDGAIVVCGNFGVAALNSDGATARWQSKIGNGERCAVGTDGTVAVIAGTRAFSFSAGGQQISAWNIAGATLFDVAVDGPSGTVIVSGYSQKNVAGACNGKLQVAFVRGWSYGGAAKWRSYDWSAQEVAGANLCIDTRVRRVAIGRDGQLYLAGAVNGSVSSSIFARDPKNIGGQLGPGQNVTSDQYNTPSRVGQVTMTWFGRYNPANGALVTGSTLLTRANSSAAGSVNPRAITADERGTVYLSGDMSCCAATRGALRVGGTPVGAYENGEGFLAVYTADLSTRIYWTPFAGPAPASAGNSPARNVAVRNGTFAVSLDFAPAANRSLITANALQGQPGGTGDGYIVVSSQR